MAPGTSPAPVVELPAERDASWGTRWGTMVRYLEDRAPCIYVPLDDLTHSNISPHLSNRVAVVGVVPDNDPRYLDQVERLGRYWNAIVCLHADVAQLVAERHPDMADRIVHVAPESTEAGFTALFGEIMAPNQARPFQRPKGLLRKPPYRVAGSDVFPILYFRGVRDVGVFPSYREDYDDYRRASGAPLATTLPEWRPELARMYPVIVGASVVADPVADPFVAAVTRGLQKADHPVQVLVASGARVAVQSGRFGKNSPVFDVPSGAMFWRTSERALVKYIERRAPCLFLPGGEPMFSDILPRLSQEVGVIARVDDLSPATLDRVRATGRYWRAVVAASPAIAAGLLEAVPSLSSWLVTIPLGIEIPDRLTERALSWQTPLKVVVAGAATDIANIADALAVGGVSVEVATAGDPTAAAFEGRDVIVVCDDAENYLVHVQQAMGRGCVPVIVSGNQAIANLVKDGETGYRVADNDMAALVGRLDALQKNPALCRAIAVRAFRSVRSLADDLAVSYMMLFERVLREIEFAPTTRKGRRDEHG
jgi:hypothetical protein